MTALPTPPTDTCHKHDRPAARSESHYDSRQAAHRCCSILSLLRLLRLLRAALKDLRAGSGDRYGERPVRRIYVPVAGRARSATGYHAAYGQQRNPQHLQRRPSGGQDHRNSSMSDARRTTVRYARAAFNRMHWRALIRAPRVYGDFWRGYVLRYVLGRGSYPYTPNLRTPTGAVCPTVYGLHDLFTVTEVFVWSCYETDETVSSFVDFGGNIGISALYFLSRNSMCRGYVFEPLRSNVLKCHDNLSAYGDRVSIVSSAVFDHDGDVEMSVESTGRYSGIGLDHDEKVSVSCVEVNGALDKILQKEQQIDVLKVDVEGAEKTIIPLMNTEHLSRIGTIYIESEEFDFSDVLRSGFSRRQHIPGIIKLVNTHWPPQCRP